MALDEEYEFDYHSMESIIKNWKRSFFRKNSRQKAFIRLRLWHPEADGRIWKYYVELSRAGKLFQKRISSAAFSQMEKLLEEKGILEECVNGVSFWNVEVFVPPNK